MTDTFSVQGDFAPVQSDTTAIEAFAPIVPIDGAVEATPAVSAVPNGFLKLGLAPELIRAVEDLGFTQPTA
ncbi:MAG: ATP-dependent helicase, partial [Pseudomonadota bacterium]|nr:ATP-dependent helicase [Pseudomonadota bacterium]